MAKIFRVYHNIIEFIIKVSILLLSYLYYHVIYQILIKNIILFGL